MRILIVVCVYLIAFDPTKKKKKPIGRVRVWHHAASVWVEFSQKTLTNNPICLAKNVPS